MTLGQRIQELRKQAGLSQEGLGEALGVSRQAVSKWEGDNGIPELDTLIAMSKLFGVTIGQLLGVEEPEEAPEAPAEGLDEERVEAILRRYVEESEGRQNRTRGPGRTWAALAGCALAALFIVVFVQIGGMKNTIRNLEDQLSFLELSLVNVRSEISGLAGDIREEISGALEESDEIISSFDHEVTGFDPEGGTVDLRLGATLKNYTAGSMAQFVLSWETVDGAKGQTVSEPVAGPDFGAVVTLPMNYRTDVSVRVILPDGSMREQVVGPIHSGMHPDDFVLETTHIFGTLLLEREGSAWGGGVALTTARGEYIELAIRGNSNGMVWPVAASVKYEITAGPVGDKSEETFDLVITEEKEGVWRLERPSDQGEYWTVARGVAIRGTLTVTDNYGREFVFCQEGYINPGGTWSSLRSAELVETPK